jgi:hypothetical protein
MRCGIKEFGHIQPTAEIPKVFVQGSERLDYINGINAVQGLCRTAKQDGVQQHQRLVIAGSMAAGAMATACYGPEFAKISREKDHNLVRFPQFIRPYDKSIALVEGHVFSLEFPEAQIP